MRRTAAAIALACLGANGIAQETVLHSTTRLVQINVVVHEKNDAVKGLTREDFSLTDRGKPQQISVFSMEVSGGAPSAAAPLPKNTFSNGQRGAATTPANVTIVLLDRLNTFRDTGADPYEQQATWIEDHALGNAKQHLLKFVDEMNARDRVAIYSLGDKLSVLSDFTNDREELKSILTNFHGGSLTSREVVSPDAIHTPVPGDFNQRVDAERQRMAGFANAKRVASTMSGLLEIAAHVANIPGRKNLVWLTANLPFSGAAVARALSRSNIAIYPVDARGLLPVAPPSQTDESYVPGLGFKKENTPPEPVGIDTMRDLADQTGGRAFVNTNDLSGAIRKAVDDAEVTYTLGFYPAEDSLDGKYHDLKVHVKRAGLEVRSPKGYFALKEASSEQSRQLEFTRAIESPLESAAIPLLARVERAKGGLNITGVIDIRNLQLEQSGATRQGAVEIYVLQQDAAGTVIDKLRSKMNLQLTAENYAAYLKSGVVFRETVAAKAGLVSLRILAGDPVTGSIGSLIVPVSTIQ